MVKDFVKTCTKCKQEKSLDLFYIASKEKRTYRSRCRVCTDLDNKKYYKKNFEKIKKYQRDYQLVNSDRISKYQSSYYYEHQEHLKSRSSAYQASHPAEHAAHSARRRERRTRATPSWLTKEQRKEIIEIYKNRPEGHHVDHIIPLKGTTVSGLHVPWNLQYLPAEENIRKSNKLEV